MALHPLTMEKAYLNISSYFSPFRLQLSAFDCEQCFPVSHLSILSKMVVIVRSIVFYNVSVIAGETTLCSFEKKFDEYSITHIRISKSKQCFIISEPFPQKSEPAIPVEFYYIWFLPLVMFIWDRLLKKYQPQHFTENQPSINKELPLRSTSETPKKHRLSFIDTTRGVAVVLMVFVNGGGGGYWFFSHSVWDGMTFADLPHPWFNSIMGVSIALANTSNNQRKPMMLRFYAICLRTVKMAIIGLCINSALFFSEIDRVPLAGNVQGLAAVYFLGSTLEMIFGNKSKKVTIPHQFSKINQWLPLKEFLSFLNHWIIMGILTAIHLLIIFGLNVPGCGRGYLGPGGDHMNGKFRNCTGGAANYIERIFISNKHIMFGLPYMYHYSSRKSFDSYGILSYLTQTVQVYLGIHAAGIFLLNKESPKLVMRKWMTLAVILTIVGFLLSNGLQNNGIIPFNKLLWSESFIFITSATALVLLTACYYLVDVIKVWNGRPCYCAGMNSLFIFLTHEVTKYILPFGWKPVHYVHGSFLFLAIYQVILWIAISVYLYQKGLIFTV